MSWGRTYWTASLKPSATDWRQEEKPDPLAMGQCEETVKQI